jgi:hypothetical protein
VIPYSAPERLKRKKRDGEGCGGERGLFVVMVNFGSCTIGFEMTGREEEKEEVLVAGSVPNLRA